MRSQASTCLSLLLLPLSISALQIPWIFAAFSEPHLDSLLSNETTIPTEHELLKRQITCPMNYNSCSTLAAADAGACCTVGSICTTDHAKNIACCPTGATCTGTVNIVGATTATGSSSAGAVLGASITATPSTSPATSTSAASVVTNIYFPFPYIPTTYANSAACMGAYSDCQSNYAACTAELEGGGFAVTIVAPAGGVTVSPTAQNLGGTSATSICSSLYDVACYGIVPSNCNTFGTNFVAGATTTMVAGAAAARITAGAYAGMVVGVGLGLAGQMI